MRRNTFLGSFAVGLALLLTATAARADQWSKNFSVTAAPHLTLEADNATLKVAPGVESEVSVRVVATGWKIPDDVRVTQQQSGNDIRVKITRTHHWFGFTHGSVTVNVAVPRQADLDLSTGNGAVTIDGVGGKLRIDTGNGAIRTNSLSGSAYLHTGNGRIEARDFDGSLQTNTGNGGVRVSGRFDALDVHSGRGGINAVVRPGSKMTSDWRIDTGVGSVNVSLPPDFSAELDGSTGVGRVSTDFPVRVSGTMTGSAVRGRIGQGGSTLRIHSGVGSIHIERAGS